MKKVIILRKIHKTIKIFVRSFFNHCSLSLSRETCGNESHEKDTKCIHASAATVLHIRIGNLEWCKSKHYQNEAREIYCLFCREVDAMPIALTEIP